MTSGYEFSIQSLHVLCYHTNVVVLLYMAPVLLAGVAPLLRMSQ